MSDLGIGAAAEAAPASPAPEAAPAANPYAPVVDRVDQLAGDFGAFREMIEQRLPAPEPVAEPDPWASLFPEAQEPDPYAAQEPQGLDPAALQQAFQQALQQANAPLQAQLQEMQLREATQQLYADIPQLAPVPEGHPEFAARQATRAETGQRVEQSLQGYAPHIAQALSQDPKYIAQVFKAAEADKRAQAQQPASEAVPSLEAAGGAVPGGNGEQPSYVQSAQQGAWQLPKGFR